MLYFFSSGIYLLVAAAVVPAVWLLIKVYRADRLEPEPPMMIVLLVLSGILSTVLAMLGERLGALLLERAFPNGGFWHELVFNFAVVGLCEEGAKFYLLRRRTWNSPQFDCMFDGVVYATSVSLGFALWENIGYVFQYGLGTALVRAVTAVPGHACFGVFMGVWYGAARRDAFAGNASRARGELAMALILPALLHGCYDFIATLTEQINTLWFIGFVTILFVIASRTVRRAAANDRYLR